MSVEAVVVASARSGGADVAAVAGAGVRPASGFVLDAVVAAVADAVLFLAETSVVFAELERRLLVLENLAAVFVFVLDEVVAFVGFVGKLVDRVGVDDRSVVGSSADCRSVAVGFGVEIVGFVESDRHRFVADGPFVAIETELVRLGLGLGLGLGLDGRFVAGAVVAEIVVELIELGVDDLIAETEPVAEIAVLGPESAEIESEAGRFVKVALAASERGRCSPA